MGFLSFQCQKALIFSTFHVESVNRREGGSLPPRKFINVYESLNTHQLKGEEFSTVYKNTNVSHAFF